MAKTPKPPLGVSVKTPPAELSQQELDLELDWRNDMGDDSPRFHKLYEEWESRE